MRREGYRSRAKTLPTFVFWVAIVTYSVHFLIRSAKHCVRSVLMSNVLGANIVSPFFLVKPKMSFIYFFF